MRTKLKSAPVGSAASNRMNIRKNNRLDSLLLIGSTGRKAGKTALACRIINKFENKNIIAIKIITIRRGDKNYHSELPLSSKGFVITEDKLLNSNTDTSRMLAAGGKRAFLLCAKRNRLENGITNMLEKMPKRAVFICESNSLRKIVEPALFVMVKGNGKIKPSAKQVIKYADRIITFNDSEFDNLLKDLRIVRGKWSIIKGLKRTLS